MTIYELLQNNFPEYLQKLQEHFPRMIKTAKEVEIIPWQDEYAIADKNPEVIDTINYLNELLEKGIITEEEYREEIKKVGNLPASKTMGVAFLQEKQVSFREENNIEVILHELGHIHFKVNDFFWNAMYGGGEILFWLGLKGKYKITEENIKTFFSFLKNIHLNPEQTHKTIVKKIASRIDVFPHLFPICLMAGYIPEGVPSNMLGVNLNDTSWEKVPISKSNLYSFFQNLTGALKWGDPFWVSYAKWLGIIEE